MKIMKKLLATFTLAPLAITACGSSADDSTTYKIFGNDYTQKEINALFENDGAKVKQIIDNADTGPANIVKGFGVRKSEEEAELYTFTNVDGTIVQEKTYSEAFRTFSNTVNKTKISNMAPGWENAIKVGQHQINGKNPPSSNTVISSSIYNVKPLGTADVSTVLSVPALGNTFSAFTGTTYTSGLKAAVSGSSVDHNEARFTIDGHAPGTGSAYQIAKDFDFGGFYTGGATIPWKVHSSGKHYQKLYLDRVVRDGLLFGEELTHSTPFMSWYAVDWQDFSTVGSKPITGGYLAIKLALFEPNGTLMKDVATIEIPKVKVTSSDIWVQANAKTANKEYIESNLFTELNASARTTSATVKKAGSAILEPGYAKGVSFYNAENDTYLFFKSDLEASATLPDWTNNIFSWTEERVEAAFKSWLNANTFGQVHKHNGIIQTWKWFGKTIGSSYGWSQEYSTKEQVYNNICYTARLMYEESAKKEANWNC